MYILMDVKGQRTAWGAGTRFARFQCSCGEHITAAIIDREGKQLPAPPNEKMFWLLHRACPDYAMNRR